MNKKAIITGALGGIGLATAKLFKKNGWHVIGTDLKENSDSSLFDQFTAMDLADEQAIKEFCDSLLKQHDSIEAIVNNAATQIPKGVSKLTYEDWQKTFAVNVIPASLLLKSLHPLLKEGQGAIVNVCSIHAVATSQNIAAYAASKGALLSLTRSMALEFAEDSIRINAVLPGAIDTEMLRQGLSRGHLKSEGQAEQLAELAKKHPLKRIGQPDEIAKLIYFLIDNDQSSFTTGQSFIADGGVIAQLTTE